MRCRAWHMSREGEWVKERVVPGAKSRQEKPSGYAIRDRCSNPGNPAQAPGDRGKQRRVMLKAPRGRCGCGEIGIRGGLKIHWGFPRCRFDSDQPHHSVALTHSAKRPAGKAGNAGFLRVLTGSQPAQKQT